MAQIYKTLKCLSILFLITVILFFIIEGVASTILVLDPVFESLIKKSANKQTCLTYDPLLGWTLKPNVKIDNFVAEKDFTIINAQGFRNRENFSHKIPEGKIRILCAGDSFTFGYGVNNDETWGAFLEKMDPRIEVLNMGVPGYGIDQIYLRYMYDGLPFQHNIHLFAFDTWDFERSQKAVFCGLAKPRVQLEGGRLLVTGVPVPKSGTPFIETIKKYIPEFKCVEFFKRLISKLSPPQVKKRLLEQKTISENEIKHVSIKILETLDRIDRKKGSVFIAVYLPTEYDYEKDREKSSELRAFFSKELAERNIRYFDLVSIIGQEPAFMLRERIFGHYTISGNKFIANALYEQLLSIPEISDLLRSNGKK